MTREEIAQVLKNMRLKSGLTQKQTAEYVGKKQQTIASWEVGQSQPDADTLFVLCDLYGTTVNEAFGFGVAIPMPPRSHRIAKLYEQAIPRDQKLVDTILEPYADKIAFIEETAADLSPTLTLIKEPVLRPVPEYTLPAAAGTGEFLDSDDFDMVDVDDRVPLSANFGVRIRGDSMEPKYPDGHVAWVRRSSSVDVGTVGVFMLDGQGYIKKMGRGELISLNPKYDPIPLPEDGEDFRVSGVVVGVTEDVYC